MGPAAMLWRRLDTPGHDTCRLRQADAGWILEGTAIFGEAEGPALLNYQVACDDAWRATLARVRGCTAARSVHIEIARSAGGVWTLNGGEVAGVAQCVDLDFEFSPATNATLLRRLALQVGQAADVTVAWLDVRAGSLTPLPQHYERRSATSYWYESPTTGYRRMLEVNAAGFTTRYPDLWESEI